MPVISVTCLHLRSFRFEPSFWLHSFRSMRQAKCAPGFVDGRLLADRNRAYWTMSCWRDEAAMRAYVVGEQHHNAMTLLPEWCDEASSVHWDQADDTLPSWGEADTRMRTQGRPMKVLHPGPNHASLTFPAPRPRATARI